MKSCRSGTKGKERRVQTLHCSCVVMINHSLSHVRGSYQPSAFLSNVTGLPQGVRDSRCKGWRVVVPLAPQLEHLGMYNREAGLI